MRAMREKGSPMLNIPPQNAVVAPTRRSSLCEPFVDADAAAEFLMVKRKTILDWARADVIPAHPFGKGKRVVWRFRISEIAGHSKRVKGTMNSAVPR